MTPVAKRLAKHHNGGIVFLSVVRRKDYRLYRYAVDYFIELAPELRDERYLLVDDTSLPPIPQKHSFPVYNRLYYQARKSGCTVPELKEALGWQDEKFQQIEQLHRKGYTVRKIAAETGYSKSAVGRVVKKIKSAEKKGE
ncbi:hypothetical protein DFP93_101200 [Aneurinibacillus soli]|uniref:Uncharacterized protein n=1 Tax=Aneurinibacillus soli TaxID=1500254 RepID=A0A0U5BB51_9BACL|nr:helix-turn-helix domain-containing protein [Aneurinibacillus soli]PYE64175.1 hypothetical protein DFP93_101200 [Aneurinibacillus soli]BAU28124.1 hypothetical protein CB4_02298 [Aneurinibacillus soli]